MRSFTNFILGAILGGMIGAALAILLTPAPGDELRSQIQARIENLRTEVQQAATNRRTELEKQLTILRSPHKTE